MSKASSALTEKNDPGASSLTPVTSRRDSVPDQAADSSVQKPGARRPKTTGRLCKFAVAVSLFAVANAALLNVAALKPKPLDRQSFEKDLARADACGMPGAGWVARGYVEQETAPDIVVFGSSQMGGLQAADAQTLNRTIDFVEYHRAATLERDLKARLSRQFNESGEQKRAPGEITSYTLALPGSMASDHYVMSRALFTPALTPKIAVVGLSPRDFMDNFLPSPGATEQFHYFSRYIELGSLSAVAFPDLLGRVDWFMTEKMPLRRLSQALLPAQALSSLAGDGTPGTASDTRKNGDSLSAIKNNQLLTTIYTSSGNIKPGECLISPHMPDLFVDNTYEYRRRYRKTNPPVYGQELIFFKEFLKTMQQKGIATVIIGMPLIVSNRAQLPVSFWNKFRNDIGSLCRQYGASWQDFSDSTAFDTSDFVDTVHLNARGGTKLSKIIADQIAGNAQAISALQK
ncbi:MAG TPA: hypothetical protein V6C72_12195 [Chroococcales cyanobacterium]